jgi:8-oxo-dGTP pyrophosphatase MutT (NUDIX family)
MMNHVSTTISGKTRRLFDEEPCRLQVAALPWRNGKRGIEVMLITSRDTGRWLVPKGWPELGEELHESAAREAHEEAGLEGVTSPVEAGRYFYSKVAAGTGMRCEVMVYPLEVRGTAGKWKEKGKRKRKWVSPARAAEMVAEPDLAELILSFAAGWSNGG